MDIEKLVTDNMKLVYHIFNTKFYKDEFVRINRDDIIQEGMLGLCKAARGFTPDNGTKFSSYAGKCIYNSMCLYLRNAKYKGKEVSLDTPITSNGQDTITLSDVLPSLDNDIEDYIETQDLKERIQAFYPKLSDKQKKVIDLGLKGLNQYQIAEQIGISRSYVSRLLQTAHSKVKKLAGE